VNLTFWRRLAAPATPATRTDQLENELHEADLQARIAIQAADRFLMERDQALRRLAAEEAENKRLIALIGTLNLPDIRVPEMPPIQCLDRAFLVAEVQRHRANATRLEDRLAVAEGRVTHVRSAR
jgi:hypothetical protein